MKTIALGITALALVAGGGAYAAQSHLKRTADADGNGVVTRAEAQAAAAARFARMDRNKDGKIDQTDRQLARQERKERRFARLDTNGDGQISKAEFMADHGRRQGGPQGNRMAMAGADGTTGRGHWGGHGRGHHGGMMMAKMADANHDGVITQAEFADAAMRRFDRIDANKDGQITQAERQAAHEQMKAQWQQMRAQRAQG